MDRDPEKRLYLLPEGMLMQGMLMHALYCFLLAPLWFIFGQQPKRLCFFLKAPPQEVQHAFFAPLPTRPKETAKLAFFCSLTNKG